MSNKTFKCKSCYFYTNNEQIFKNHSLSEHKEEESLIKNKSPKQKLIEEKQILMKQRILTLIENATLTEKVFQKELNIFFPTKYFIFQKGFLFRHRNFFLIVDFYFPKENIIIEIDGDYYKDPAQRTKDILRERKLKNLLGNVQILRFTNNQVISNSSSVMKIIENAMNKETTISEIKNKGQFFVCKVCKITCKDFKRLSNHFKNSHAYTKC